jgi:hypothetical protein
VLYKYNTITVFCAGYVPVVMVSVSASARMAVPVFIDAINAPFVPFAHALWR